MIVLKVIVILMIVGSLIMATWSLSVDFFKRTIPKVFGFIVGILFLYFGYKLLWKAVPMSNDPAEKAEYNGIIDRYYYGKTGVFSRKDNGGLERDSDRVQVDEGRVRDR